MKNFKVAVVGCGTIGNAHCAAWSRLENVELVAVCDLAKEKADAFAKKYSCQAVYSIDDLPVVDVVSVVTPPFAHFAVVKSILEKGISVFCEKPLTMNVAEGEELVALAKAKGLQLGIGFKMRFEPVFQEAKKLFPEIGTLRAIVTTKQQKFSAQSANSEWVKRTGAMYELSVHDFDLITYITGKIPQKVLFAQLKHNRGWEKEDGFAAIVDYGDGVIANLQGMYCDDTTFCFRDLAITLLGEKGYMRIERPDRIIVHTSEYRVVDIPKGTRNTFDIELEHFKDAVSGVVENSLNGENAVRMTDLIESIREFDTFK